MENNKKMAKEAKLIFNAGVCRALLKAGCTIIDVKPDRENSINNVFVFKADEHFWEEFERINREIAEAKAADVVL